MCLSVKWIQFQACLYAVRNYLEKRGNSAGESQFHCSGNIFQEKWANLRYMIFILTGQTQVFQLTYKTSLEGHHYLQFKTNKQKTKFKAKKKLTDSIIFINNFKKC